MKLYEWCDIKNKPGASFDKYVLVVGDTPVLRKTFNGEVKRHGMSFYDGDVLKNPDNWKEIECTKLSLILLGFDK